MPVPPEECQDQARPTQQFPDRVKISGHVYDVTKLDLSEQDYIGLCVYNKTQILVHDQLSESREKEVVVHECVHAIAESYGANLKEKQVEQMGEGIYMWLKNNPDLIRWIVGPAIT